MKPAWSTARIALAAAAGLAAVLAVAGTASAHVTVNPREAEQGGYARLDFRVPNERDETSTVQLEVHFPEEAPFGSVSTAPVPGWSVDVSYRTLDEPAEAGHGGTITEAVETITWTADSEETAVQPGQFREFPISVGPMPDDIEQLFFRTLQTYSDDEVVRWIDVPQDGEEVESPAPALRLTPAGGDHGAEGSEETDAAAAGSEDGDPDDPAAAAVETSADGDSGSGAGVWLGLAGLVAGIAGLALGGLAFARTRRS